LRKLGNIIKKIYISMAYGYMPSHVANLRATPYPFQGRFSAMLFASLVAAKSSED
jgi:hypothetical protein